MQWGRRPAWPALPAGVRDGIETLLGAAVVDAVTPPGGHSPQLAARLRLSDDRTVFVKAAPGEAGFAETDRREAAITAALPDKAPAPAVLATGEAAGWFVAVYADVPGRHPNISPESLDLDPVLDTLADVAVLPVSAELQSVLRGTADVELAGYLHGWDVLAHDPPDDVDLWAAPRLRLLATIEGDRAGALAGTALSHSDGRPDNMLIADGHVTLVDWSHALTGAAWLDAAFLVPQMILDGWEPAEALAVIRHRVLGDADQDAVTAFWVALTGYWQHAGRQPSPPGAPGLRPYQRAAAAAGTRLLQLLID
ncbi:phosphotransferase family protein [Catenulispora pinisilvae]|uniref:phosphotransferase family protein n=1 Tax=Catenulispora pinisilvae TaxID=2705253 RepID=UPI001891DCF2|nr:aminoglycoside phosphotransferase [Catenulispora pinisilvae]